MTIETSKVMHEFDIAPIAISNEGLRYLSQFGPPQTEIQQFRQRVPTSELRSTYHLLHTTIPNDPVTDEANYQRGLNNARHLLTHFLLPHEDQARLLATLAYRNFHPSERLATHQENEIAQIIRKVGETPPNTNQNAELIERARHILINPQNDSQETSPQRRYTFKEIGTLRDRANDDPTAILSEIRSNGDITGLDSVLAIIAEEKPSDVLALLEEQVILPPSFSRTLRIIATTHPRAVLRLISTQVDISRFDDVLSGIAKTKPHKVFALLKEQPDADHFNYTSKILALKIPHRVLRFIEYQQDPAPFGKLLYDIATINPKIALEFIEHQKDPSRFSWQLSEIALNLPDKVLLFLSQQQDLSKFKEIFNNLYKLDPQILLKYFTFHAIEFSLPKLPIDKIERFKDSIETTKKEIIGEIVNKVKNDPNDRIRTYLADRPYMELFFINLALQINPTFFNTTAGVRYLEGEAFSAQLFKDGSHMHLVRDFEKQMKIVNTLGSVHAQEWNRLYAMYPDKIAPYLTGKNVSGNETRVTSISLGPNLFATLQWLEAAHIPPEYSNALARSAINVIAHISKDSYHGHLHAANIVVIFQSPQGSEYSPDPINWIEDGWIPLPVIIDFDRATMK